MYKYAVANSTFLFLSLVRLTSYSKFEIAFQLKIDRNTCKVQGKMRCVGVEERQIDAVIPVLVCSTLAEAALSLHILYHAQ